MSAPSPSTIADPSISPGPVPSSPSPTSATMTAGSPPGNSPIPSPVMIAHPSSHHRRPLTGDGYLTMTVIWYEPSSPTQPRASPQLVRLADAMAVPGLAARKDIVTVPQP